MSSGSLSLFVRIKYSLGLSKKTASAIPRRLSMRWMSLVMAALTITISLALISCASANGLAVSKTVYLASTSKANFSAHRISKDLSLSLSSTSAKRNDGNQQDVSLNKPLITHVRSHSKKAIIAENEAAAAAAAAVTALFGLAL